MTEEIQWLRPVQLCGFRKDTTSPGAKVGHCWVVLGYDMSTSKNQFLMNLGGGGIPNWYTCDTSILYPLYQDHITGIAPQNNIKFVGDTNPGNGSPADPYEDIEEAIAEAPDGATLIFKAGSVNTFSISPLVVDRPFTLIGKNVTIREQ